MVNENKKNKSCLNGLHIFQVLFRFCLHSCRPLLSETWLPPSSLTALEMLGFTSLSGGEKLLENSLLGQGERRGSSSRFPYQLPSKWIVISTWLTPRDRNPRWEEVHAQAGEWLSPSGITISLCLWLKRPFVSTWGACQAVRRWNQPSGHLRTPRPQKPAWAVLGEEVGKSLWWAHLLARSWETPPPFLELRSRINWLVSYEPKSRWEQGGWKAIQIALLRFCSKVPV